MINADNISETDINKIVNQFNYEMKHELEDFEVPNYLNNIDYYDSFSDFMGNYEFEDTLYQTMIECVQTVLGCDYDTAEDLVLQEGLEDIIMERCVDIESLGEEIAEKYSN